jgi:hypothetical protein
MTEQGQEKFVSAYSWLIAPGDRLQVDDYHTPTRSSSWGQANLIEADPATKQERYGQWLAQLLQCHLGVDLVPLYRERGQTKWPITLRDDVIDKLDGYFSRFNR